MIHPENGSCILTLSSFQEPLSKENGTMYISLFCLIHTISKLLYTFDIKWVEFITMISYGRILQEWSAYVINVTTGRRVIGISLIAAFSSRHFCYTTYYLMQINRLTSLSVPSSSFLFSLCFSCFM